MKNFDDKKILVDDFKPCPYFLDWSSRYEHRMLFVEPLIRVQTHLIYNDEPFFPPA